MGRAALENARRFAPGPVVRQAERLLEEACEARRTGRPVTRDRDPVGRVLTGRGHAARDAVYATGSSALRTIRKARR
jgi:hypothetical protein